MALPIKISVSFEGLYTSTQPIEFNEISKKSMYQEAMGAEECALCICRALEQPITSCCTCCTGVKGILQKDQMQMHYWAEKVFHHVAACDQKLLHQPSSTVSHLLLHCKYLHLHCIFRIGFYNVLPQYPSRFLLTEIYSTEERSTNCDT